MLPDTFTIKTMYYKAFDEYLEAIDQITDLFDSKKNPELQEHIMASTRLRHARDKLIFIVNVSLTKYHIVLDMPPSHVIRGGMA